MKPSIYDRIPDMSDDELRLMLDLWSRMIASRDRSPRHDYHGRCVLRAALELERREAESRTGVPGA